MLVVVIVISVEVVTSHVGSAAFCKFERVTDIAGIAA